MFYFFQFFFCTFKVFQNKDKYKYKQLGVGLGGTERGLKSIPELVCPAPTPYRLPLLLVSSVSFP